MASFKNMEMAPIVASHPHIFVKLLRPFYPSVLPSHPCRGGLYPQLLHSLVWQRYPSVSAEVPERPDLC